MEHGREETEEELNEALRLRYQRMSLVKDPKITVRDNMGIIILSIVLISLLLFISIFALVSHYTSSDNVSLLQSLNATTSNLSKQTNMTGTNTDAGKFRMKNDTACLDKNLETFSENNSSDGVNIDSKNNTNVIFKGTSVLDTNNRNDSSTNSSDSIDSKTSNTSFIDNTTQHENDNATGNISSLVNNAGTEILDEENNFLINETTLIKSGEINNGSTISDISDVFFNTSNNVSFSGEADKLNNTKMSHNGNDCSNITENTNKPDTAVKTTDGVINSIETTTAPFYSALTTSSNLNPYWNSRFLPDTVIPVHYDLYLDISIMSTSGWCYDFGMYTGNVTISVIVRTSTDFIVIHANDLRLNADRIVIKRNNKHIMDHIEDITYNYEYEYYIIKISDYLEEGVYEVTIVEFMGCITNTSEGLVLSSYVTDSGEVSSEDRGAKVILDGGWQKRGSGRTNNSMSGINTSIIQMAIPHAESNQTFSCYVKPKCGFIPNNITKLTGIMLYNNIMYHNGNEVNPMDIKEACRQMMQFLKQFSPVILVDHNVLFDSKVLIQNMNECSLTCDGVIDGFGDTLRLFKNECPERKTNGQNYKQEDLVRDILGKDYNAHSAIADNNELLHLVRTVYNFEEKLPMYDNIENRIKRCSNQAKYSESYADIVGKCYLSSAPSKTLATAGLSFHHIKIIHSRSGVDGLTALCKQILSNPQKVTSSVSKYL